MEGKKLSKKALIIIIAAAVLVIAAVIILAVVLGGNKDKKPAPTDAPAITDVPSASATPEITKDPAVTPDPNATPEPRQIETDSIVIPGIITLNLPANNYTAEVELLNPEANKGKYQMCFSLSLPGYDEPVFVSDFVDGGSAVTSVTLTDMLDAGVFEGTLLISPRRTDGTLTNNAEIKVTVIVR